MEITVNNINELNAILKIKISPADYEPRVNKSFNKIRKTANIKGFRIGMAPIGMIKKMYGKGILMEEINKILPEALNKYMNENRLNILGEPIPSIHEKTNFDLENDAQTDFEFNFDLGLPPKIDISLDILKDIPKYKIVVNEELVNKQVNNYQQQSGNYIVVEEIQDKCLVNVDFSEVDEEFNHKENGFFKENASVLFNYIKDEEIKAQFLGKKLEDKLFIDIKKAFPNETDLAGMLGLKKEEIADLGNLFSVTINKIQLFVDAELGKELYDKIFPSDNIETEEGFRQKIKSIYEKSFSKEAEYKLFLDAKDRFMQENVELPIDFLKRWLMLANEDKKVTKEQLDKEFPYIEQDFKWKLIKESYIKKHNLFVDESDALEIAKEFLGYELSQYGIAIDQFPAEQLEKFAKEKLENKEKPEEKTRIYERASEQKFTNYLVNNINFETKEISLDDFNKMFEKVELPVENTQLPENQEILIDNQ